MKKDNYYDFADEAPYSNDDKIEVITDYRRGYRMKKVIVKQDYNYNKRGTYYSFEIDEIDNKEVSDKKIELIKNNLIEMMKELKIKKNPHVLMVGLGNDEFSSDAFGPQTIKNINANSYLSDVNSKVSCLIPGVMKTTGLESAMIIKSLVDKFKFDLVVVFDSLTTKNINRLFKVIQITDTEIIPGAGIKNFRKSLNSTYLGVPLIAVGVSMAICYSSIIEDVLTHIDGVLKVNKENKKYLLNNLNSHLVLTGKDSEIKVKCISKNVAKIFNSIFTK